MANRQMGFLLLEDLQGLMREEGKVSSFNIRLHDPGSEDSRQDLCGMLESLFPELSFFPSETLAGQSTALGFLRAFTGATAAIALCVALIVTVNTLLMSVTERMSEFAIYSARDGRRSRPQTWCCWQPWWSGACGENRRRPKTAIPESLPRERA
jgi:ABC-type lipoprotein release transport system permease subunit